MTNKIKETISHYFSAAVFWCSVVFLSYAFIFFLWEGYYKYLLKNKGEQVVATIVDKYNGTADYDIEYDGNYYRSWINLSKIAYRQIQIGERFYALILPDKLRHYHKNGITPNCFTIILEPLPECQQRIEEEKQRINNLYNR